MFSIKSTFSILLINLAFRLCLASRVTFSIPSQNWNGCECSDELVFLSFSFQCAAAAIFTFHCVLNAALWHFSALLEMEVRRVIVVSSCRF